MALTSFPLSFILSALDRGVTATLGRVGGKLGKLGASASAVGRQMSTGLTLPIVGAGAAVLATSLSFDKSLNRVSALLGAPRAEMAALEDQAKSLGSSTAFSAREVAESQAFLAQAGLDMNRILGLTPSVLDLAAAGQMELGATTDLLTDVLKGYGAEVDQANKFSNVLAATSVRSTQTLEQLGDAMRFAGPVAKGLGLEVEETAAVLGAFADAGFKGEMGGTALRGSLVKLVNPSREAQKILAGLGIRRSDILRDDGTLVGLTDTIELLGERGATTAQLMAIFGQRAGPAMAAAVGNGTDGIRALNAELEGGLVTATSIAELQLQGSTGAVVRLRSAFEGLLISIGDSGLLDHFADLATWLSKVFVKVGQLNPTLLKVGVILAGIVAVIGPALILFGAMASGVGAVTAAWGLLAPVAAGFATLLTGAVIPAIVATWTALIANPLGPILIAISLVTGAAILLWKNWDQVSAGLVLAWEWLRDTAVGVFTTIREKALGMLSILPDWLIDFLKGTNPVAALFIGDDLGSASRIDRALGNGDGAPGAGGDARVRVSFDNLPPGAQVTTDGDSDVPLDLDAGYAMLGA